MAESGMGLPHSTTWRSSAGAREFASAFWSAAAPCRFGTFAIPGTKRYNEPQHDDSRTDSHRALRHGCKAQCLVLSACFKTGTDCAACVHVPGAWFSFQTTPIGF